MVFVDLQGVAVIRYSCQYFANVQNVASHSVVRDDHLIQVYEALLSVELCQDKI